LDPLNLFYEEPDTDRWIKFDRYPRNIIRRLIRGKPRPGGQQMVAINLMKGLKKIGIPYRINDYRHIKKHPDEIACIIGKPQVLFERQWANPVIFGAAIYSHPIECPQLFVKYPHVKRALVPGGWMREMFEPYYGNKVTAWPVGIDTERWVPSIKQTPEFDFLIYDKVRWDHTAFEENLIKPITRVLEKHNKTYRYIKYGHYQPADLANSISKCKAVIFLCEHETQGLAYQQILSTNTPVLAWDRGGYWQDPYYYPHKVKYQPVSSVPYWDERCGLKFKSADDFESRLIPFFNGLQQFNPRSYILENLTLQHCAEHYLTIYKQVQQELA